MMKSLIRKVTEMLLKNRWLNKSRLREKEKGWINHCDDALKSWAERVKKEVAEDAVFATKRVKIWNCYMEIAWI